MTSLTDVVVIGAGQSGLAAASALRTHGITPVVLEAGQEPAGSVVAAVLRQPDSVLSGPLQRHARPGLPRRSRPLPAPRRGRQLPTPLRRYADGLDADIRTRNPVTAVVAHDQGGFLVRTATGQAIRAAGVVAASGSFGNPHLPVLPGQDGFTGRLLHVASYRDAQQHAGERVVVVGAGNSAVQVGFELAQVATVTLTTRHPITLHPQRRGGQELDVSDGERGAVHRASVA